MSKSVKDLPYRHCVGIALMNRKGKVFVGQRIDTVARAWQMPQGGIDKDETPAEAALRELWEETGVTADLVETVAETPDWVGYDLPVDLVPKIWGGKYRGQKQRWFLFRFLGEDRHIKIATDHPEFAEWRWLGADEVLAEIVPFKREVYAQVIESFRPYLT